MEGKSDLVTSLLNRLGNVGLLFVACALLLGGLAGAAVAHQFDGRSTNTVAAHQDDSGKGAKKPKNQPGNQKHENRGHQDGGRGSNPAGTD